MIIDVISVIDKNTLIVKKEQLVVVRICCSISRSSYTKNSIIQSDSSVMLQWNSRVTTDLDQDVAQASGIKYNTDEHMYNSYTR